VVVKNNVKAAAGFDLADWLSGMGSPTREVTVRVDGSTLGAIHHLVERLAELGESGPERADLEAELAQLRARRARSAAVFVVRPIGGELRGEIVSKTPELPGEKTEDAAIARRQTKMVGQSIVSITRADGSQVEGPIGDGIMSQLRTTMGESEFLRLRQALDALEDDGGDDVDPTFSPGHSGDSLS
jgi:hypothetical protein